MKIILLLLFSILSSFVFAQERELEKIQKLYNAGKYEKALKNCDHLIASKEGNKNPEAYFYKSILLFAMLDSSSSSYTKQLTNCLNTASKGISYDKQRAVFTEENQEIKKITTCAHKHAEYKYYTNKQKEAKSIEGILAKNFKDTSELFYTLFLLPRNKISIQPEPTIALPSKSTKIDSIVFIASLQVGKPYQFGKEGPTAFDCSGFIGYVFKNVGEKLPHNANMISKLGKEINFEQIKKGDLIFFGSTSAYHVAMFVGENSSDPKIIHCVSRGVCIDEFTSTSHWGKSNVYKIKRLLD